MLIRYFLCRDDKGAHKLIARTEAKEKYMLKDCDLDLRKPVLRYISRKNPHNPRYGEMKLYLKAQVRSRSFENVLGIFTFFFFLMMMTERNNF